MATPSNKPPRPAAEPRGDDATSPASWPIRALDAAYRFLASLKLAVILLTTLAAVLAYATFYESANGTHAVQVDIYRSRAFALLLALLGVNILCAATIRFPWKRRQTGFVVTHAGLLVLLVGSFISLKVTDEGRIGLVEGESAEKFVRIDDEVIRLQKVDPDTGRVERQFEVPFHPGAAPWETPLKQRQASDPKFRQGFQAKRGAFGLIAMGLLGVVIWMAAKHPEQTGRPLGAALATLATLSAIGLGYQAATMRVGPRTEVLTDPSDPFRLVAKDYLPSATEPRPVYGPGEGGVPMLRVALLTQPPGQPAARDALGGRGWIQAVDRELAHGSSNLGPARLEFQELHGPKAEAALASFLDPPADPLKDRRARFHYVDLEGKARTYDWLIQDEERMKVEGNEVLRQGKTVTLPGSDLTASLVGVLPLPTANPAMLEGLDARLIGLLGRMGRAVEAPAIYAAVFKVRKGDGPEISHIGWANLPLAPTVTPFGHAEHDAEELLWIDYYHPPRLSGEAGMMAGTFGAVDFVVGPDRKTYVRAIGRDGLKAIGPIERGEPLKIFGGGQMPMQVSVRVDDYLDSGVGTLVCEPLELPKDRMDEATPAVLLEMTLDGQSREFWLPRTESLEPRFQAVDLDGGAWRISYDFDTRGLPFEVSLVDFNPSNDPGSTARAAFRSDVFVTDLDAKPETPKAFSALDQGRDFYFVDRPRESFLKVSTDAYRSIDGGADIPIGEDRAKQVQPIPPPTKITMNYPMVRDDWTFYQTAFNPVLDRSGRPSGSFVSILSVRYDPAWPIVYGGSLLVVVGTFLQFYMRAGVFSGAGKKSRRREGDDELPVEPEPAEVAIDL